MTVKEVATRAGIATKTLSNRLLRAGCDQYKSGDVPEVKVIMGLLKKDELHVFNGGSLEHRPVQKKVPKAPSKKAQAVDVEAIMAAVGTTLKEREGRLVQRFENQFESLEATVKEHRTAWGDKLAGLHDAAKQALEVAERSQQSVEEATALVDQMEKQKPQPAGLVGILFGSEVALLVAAGMLMCFGAYAYQRVVSVLVGTDDWGTAVFAFTAGLVVHYAGLLNAYRKSKAPGPRYGTHPVVYWIAAFMVFECVLHACNYSAFGTATPYLAKLVMTVSVPLATAALADAMLTPNTPTDGTTK